MDKNQRAFAAILRTLDPILLNGLPTEVDAQGIWLYLHDTFQHASVSSRSALSRQLYAKQMKPGDDPSLHIAQMKALRAQLAEMGQIIQEDTMVSLIISSLDASWNTFVLTLEGIYQGQLTTDYISSRIVEEHRRRQEMRAHQRSTQPKRQGRTSGHSQIKCASCGQAGHQQHECFKQQQQQQQQPLPPAQPRGKGKSKSKPKKPKEKEGHQAIHITHNVKQLIDYNTKKLWLIDSGASKHIANNKDCFIELRPSENTVKIASGEDLHVEGEGTIYLPELGKIHDVLLVPSINTNLLSAFRLNDAGFLVMLQGDKSCLIFNGEIVANILRINHLPYLEPKVKVVVPALKDKLPEADPVKQPEVPTQVQRDTKTKQHCKGKEHANTEGAASLQHINTGKPLHAQNCVHNIHRILGHASFQVVKKMPEFSEGLDIRNCKVYLECAVCKHSKAKTAVIPKHATRKATRMLQLLHLDLVGPLPTSNGNNKYFLTIVDDYSRYGFVRFLKQKSEAAKVFQEWTALVENQFETKIAQIQTDCGTEFMSTNFKNWLNSKGIKHFTTAPYSPHQNGVAERRNGTLQTMMRSLLADAKLPISFWAEAIRFANYVINRLWSRVIEQTPYFMLYGKKPNLSHLRLFGSTAWVHIPKQARKKGDPVSKKMKFMGYVTGSKAYKFYDKGNRVVVSRSANFEQDADWSRIHSNDVSIYIPQDTIEVPVTPAVRDRSPLSDQRSPSLPPPLKASTPRRAPARSGSPDDSRAPASPTGSPPKKQARRTSPRTQPESLDIPRAPPSAPATASQKQARKGSSKQPPSSTKPTSKRGSQTRFSGTWTRSREPDAQTKPGVVSQDEFPSDWFVETEDEEEPETSEEEEVQQLPRRSARTTKGVPPKRFGFPVAYVNHVLVTPKTYSDVLSLPEQEQNKWKQAMQKEMDSLKKLQVYTPTEVPRGKRMIGTRWVYKLKTLPNDELLYKARLVAQGYCQRFPDEFSETYSPTVRSESVKSALAVAAALNEHVYQFDVQTAYLHAGLQEEIYVKAAPGFEKSDGRSWRLHKSLYGLKQSGRMWYLCLSNKLKQMGFVPSRADACVFTRRTENGHEKVLVYVDDLLYICQNKHMSDKFTQDLQQHFTLKSLGQVNTYLGVHITRTQKGFSLSQKDKIVELLKNCNMQDSKPMYTPMQTDFCSHKHTDSEDFPDQTLYRSVIGSLLYISNWTRPDIALSVNLLSRYVSNPKVFHWKALKRVLRYLKGTQNVCLCLEPTDNCSVKVDCFADADWAGNRSNRRSTSGFVFFLNGCPVYWKVAQQKFISCSTAEAEFACLSDACNALVWFNVLIENLWAQPALPVPVFEDNQAAIAIAESNSIGTKSRHIDIRYRNVQEHVSNGCVVLKYCKTESQVADVFTKPLPRDRHAVLCEGLCLHSV